MKKIKINICAGTTCFVMGASYLLTLEDYLDPEIKDFIEIVGARCLGLCKNDNFGGAPYVIIDDMVMCEATVPKILDQIDYLLANQNQAGESNAT